MSEKTLTQKLGLKPGNCAIIFNAPDGYTESLNPLPDRVTITHEANGMYDFVQLFVWNKADIDSKALAAIAALRPGGVLWFSYPKKTGNIKTDITRDIGWETVYGANFGPVASVSIDDTWTGLRFKPENTVSRKPDSQFRKKT